MREIQKLDWIDALRGYAVLGVVCVHCLMGKSDIWFSQIFGFGAKGVQLFYIVSAFTLFLSFYGRRESSNTNFFTRRFFRIAPMFYLLIVYYLVHSCFAVHPADELQLITPWNIVSHFLLLHGLSPYWINSLVDGGWSVGVEMMFYIVCPILFRYITNINKALIFYIGSVIVGQLLYWFFLANPLIDNLEIWEEYIYYFLPTQLPEFAIGIVIYFILKLDSKTAFEKSLILLIPAVVFLFAVLFLHVKLQLLNNMMVCLALVPVFYVLSKYTQTTPANYVGLKGEKGGFKSRVTRAITTVSHIAINPIVRFVGKISFSMYLIHFLVISWIVPYTDVFTNPTANYFFRLFLVLGLTAAISYLTYKYIEQYFIHLGKKLIQNRK